MIKLDHTFNEFLKTLISMSLPASRQNELYGLGMIGDELAIDFGDYYQEFKNHYLEHELLTKTEVIKLDQISQFLHERSGEKFIDFWSSVEHPDWAKVRIMAQECLQVMKKEDLDLSIIHNKEEKGKKWKFFGPEIVVQNIKTEITKKNIIKLLWTFQGITTLILLAKGH